MNSQKLDLNGITNLKELFNKTSIWYENRPAYKLREKDKRKLRVLLIRPK